MNCPNCGSRIQPEDVFCVDCGQSLAAAQPPPPPATPPPARRRWPWLLLSLLLLILAAGGLAWYLDLLPASFPAFPGSAGGQPQEKPIARTDDPFLILQAYRDGELEVFAVDLAGDTLAEFGVTLNNTALPLAVVDRQYAPWPKSSNPTVPGATSQAWPDGRAVIAMGSPRGWDLLAYDAGQGEIREMMADAQSLAVSGWADVPSTLVRYTSAGEHGLLAAGEGSGEAVSLALSDDPISDVVLSPDGQQAVYQANDLFIASIDGRRTNRQRGQFQNPVFSPDGRHLYYSTGRQLIRADGDGRNAQIIAEVGRSDQIWPVSASNSYVAVQQNVAGGYDLRVMTPKGETISRAGRSDSVYQARYLPGDNGLLLVSFEGGGWQVDLANVKGEERRTLADGLQDFWAVLLRDDRHLALAELQDGRWSLTLHDLRRDDRQTLAQDLNLIRLLASNADTMVYAAVDDRGDWSLWATSLKDGETLELDAGASDGYSTAYFLPDGRELVYEAAEGVNVEQSVQPDGQTVVTQSLAGGVYRVDLNNPVPVTVYEGANLLAASLLR